MTCCKGARGHARAVRVSEGTVEVTSSASPSDAAHSDSAPISQGREIPTSPLRPVPAVEALTRDAT